MNIMDLHLLSKENDEEYVVYKDTDFATSPSIITVPQYHPKEIYVDVPGENKKIPFSIQLYIGGLSVIGLYIVYRLIKRASKD
jgi:hypothetical protein